MEPGRPSTDETSRQAGSEAQDQAAEPVQQSGEVIVVTGDRRERPLSTATVATEVITRAEIETSGATSAAELLAKHPGVEILPALRGSEIRIQGLDARYVLVLVDGVRAIGRIDGALDLERYPVENIERIEIVKGASSALYGSDAIAGTIHIITRDAERPVEAGVEARYGSRDALDLSGSLGTRAGAWRVRVTGGWHRGDGYDLEPGDAATTASAFDEKQVAARAAHTRGDVAVEASAEYLRRDLEGVDASAAGAVLDRLSATETAAARLLARWRPSAGSVVEGSLAASMFDDQFLSDQRGGSDLDQYQLTEERLVAMTAQYQRSIGERHYATAGAEIMRETLASDRLSAPGERFRMAAFAQDEWAIARAPFVTVVPGARVDVDSQFGTHATPRLAGRWDATERVVVRAGYGGGYRAPSFKELLLLFENPGAGYVVEGNPDLRPETAWSATAGVEIWAHRAVWASAQAFHNDIDDLILIDLVSDSGAGEPTRFGHVNVASAFTRGIEGMVQLRPVDGLLVELGYALTDTRDRDAGRALPGRPRHRGTIELGFARWGAEARVRAALVGARAFFEDADGDGVDEEITAEPYAAVDVRLAHTVRRRLTVFAGVMNALDQGDARFLPIAPRTLFAGAKAAY